MTHPESRTRQWRMATEVASGRSAQEVSAEFGVSVPLVRVACQAHGVFAGGVIAQDGVVARPNRGRSSCDWDSVDWSMRDADIAHELGVSRERVRQVRVSYGAPPSPDKNQSAEAVVICQWLQENRHKLEGKTSAEILAASPFAREKRYLVTRHCKRLGISVSMPVGIEKTITKENILDFVDVISSGCWEWKGATVSEGYARIGRQYGHHFAFRMFKGEIPDGLWVLHTCDNPKCINPDHLYAGTPKQNCRDRDERSKPIPGSAKLDPDKVNEVRRLRKDEGWSMGKIAAKFGVSVAAIRNVLLSHTWGHVKDAGEGLFEDDAPQPARRKRGAK